MTSKAFVLPGAFAALVIGWSVPAAGQSSPPTVPVAHASIERPWLEQLYEQVRPSVVRIRTSRGVGSGFLFHGPRYVATAYHVVEDSRFIHIVLNDGTPFEATIVAWDQENDVALLELSAEVQRVPVLLPYTDAVRVGMSVAVIGHPFSDYVETEVRMAGLLEWTLTEGIVSGVSNSWIQTDAAMNPGNSGGPLLAADGRVLGVISAHLTEGEGIGIAARANHLAELVKRIGHQEPPPRRMVTAGVFELGWSVYYDEPALSGPLLALGLTLVNAFPVRLRGVWASGDEVPGGSLLARRDVRRVAVEAEAGYYLWKGPRLALSLQAGAGLFFDRVEDTTFNVVSDGGNSVAVPSTARRNHTRVLPLLGVSPQFGVLLFNYSYFVGIAGADESQHRLSVALAF